MELEIEVPVKLWGGRVRKIRWLICGVSAAAFLALGGPVWAQGILNADSLKLYGGTYSSACSNPAAPRLEVVANALMVEVGGRRMTGTNVMISASYFGQAPPPNYVTALMSNVGVGSDGNGLLFIVYRDRAGQYIVLDGGRRVSATLGKALLTPLYRRCDNAVTIASTQSVGQGQDPSQLSAYQPKKSEYAFSEEMPEAAQVIRDIQGKDAFDTAVRRRAALSIIGSLLDKNISKRRFPLTVREQAV